MRLAESRREYRMAIRIAGEIERSFHDSTRITRRELREIARDAVRATTETRSSFSNSIQELEPVFNKMDKLSKEVIKITAAAGTAVASAIGGVAVASSRVGIEFESAFAGVKKTTEATAAEYSELREEILEMSTEMPATASEIAAVAESAGQLGIKKENLLDFSKTMIGLGEATNLSSEEAASSLAKFANITNMEAENFDRLGSTIVALGNNFATTEADIVSMSTRLAASGDLVGLSQAKIMAISTAMSSVGIEADAGGSAMSKLLKDMQVTVELEGQKLQQYAKTAGMSTEEFKKAFAEDGVEALGEWLKGLNDTERNGMSAIAVLDEMGLTEVRLSNTILSLANANGLVSEAVDIANEAWEENIALSNEVAVRYETTESKIAMLKNNLKKTGIYIFDHLQEPIRTGIDAAMGIIDSNGDILVTFFKDLSKNIPTIVRQIKQFTSNFLDFAEPVLDFGKWLIENPGVIVSTVTGLGSALATYKIAQEIDKVGNAVKGLMALSKGSLALMGIGAGIGAIVGTLTYIQKIDKEAGKQSLKEHFGDITLSLEELEKAAVQIIDNGTLLKLSESMSAFEEVDKISRSIENTTEEINRTNWKISIGMELSEEDKEIYKSNIESFITESQDLLTQTQYASSLNLKVILGDGEEGEGIRSKVNNFYSNAQGELQRLGNELAEELNKSFIEGTLPDAEVIAKIQGQMAKITEQMAQSNLNAKLELISTEYGGGNLDAETMLNLQNEINEAVKEAKEGLKEAYIYTVSELDMMKNTPISEGGITQEEYNEMLAKVNEGYSNQTTEMDVKAASFQSDTIMKQYKEELGVIDEMRATADEELKRLAEDATSSEDIAQKLEMAALEVSASNTISRADKKALSFLVEQMEPMNEQLETLKQEYEQAGKEVPEAILKGISDFTAIRAASGEQEAVWEMIGQQIGENETYALTVEAARAAGAEIPGSVSKGIKDKQPEAEKEAVALLDKIKGRLEGGIAASIPISYKIIEKYEKTGEIPGYASGGIITSPTLATFAEEVPEAAIPLDGSNSSISLWEKTGRILGVYKQEKTNPKDSFRGLSEKMEQTGTTNYMNNTPTITYSPRHEFYGGAPTEEEIVAAERRSQEEFERRIKSWFKENGRYSFAGG